MKLYNQRTIHLSQANFWKERLEYEPVWSLRQSQDVIIVESFPPFMKLFLISHT